MVLGEGGEGEAKQKQIQPESGRNPTSKTISVYAAIFHVSNVLNAGEGSNWADGDFWIENPAKSGGHIAEWLGYILSPSCLSISTGVKY